MRRIGRVTGASYGTPPSKREGREDSQVAREVEVAQPVELFKEQRQGLVQGFAQREFVEHGMVADIA